MAIQTRRLGYALCAQVTGVDLTRAIDDRTFAEIREAWREHLVLSFPGQPLTPGNLVAFAKRFEDAGHDLDPTVGTRDPDYPEVAVLTNAPVHGKPWDGYKEGLQWHSDRSHQVRPIVGTFLFARKLPAVGGNTMWSNQYRAYETLSETMRRTIEPLVVVHDITAQDDFSQRGSGRPLHPPVAHPVVKIHPETQRKALFVGERIRKFAGMSEEESRPIIDFLNAHSSRYENTYRHAWTENELVLWDNRCTLHYAPADYDLQHDVRDMMRVSVRGPAVGTLYVEDAIPAAPAAVS